MKDGAEKQHRWGRHGRAWRYAVIALINAAIFVSVGFTYVGYTRSYSRKLYDENLNNLANLNVASANAAEMYIGSMGVKLDDVAAYLEAEAMSFQEAAAYLGSTNTNADRQFQMILCAREENGAFTYGDYSGVSVRKHRAADGTLTTSEREISYKSGYTDLVRTLRDLDDEAFEGVCFAPEFTDADTKLKCFALYRHVTLKDAEGEGRYAVLLAVNSQTAQNTYNKQSGGSRSTVLMDKGGSYIISNRDFRGQNFYDYLRSYNDLSMEQRTALEQYVLNTVGNGQTGVSVNLFYKNHEGADCVFCITGMANDWYSITCVPQSSFRLTDEETDYSLIILLLFITLFIVDGIVIYFAGKAMRHNVVMAETAMEAANNANAAKSSFLSTMSHELRTPLNAIIGYNVIARDTIAAWKDAPQPDDVKELDASLNKSGIASRHLLSIINDVLDMATIENGKIKLVNAPFDFSELIDSIDALFVAMAADNGLSFTVEKDIEEHIWLSGDKTRLNQILVNLLNNAIKFTPAGGSVCCRIAAHPAEDGDGMRLRFAVEDTGIGMSEEFLANLWTPFVQADATASKRYGGTGLGLAITKSLVEMMGGEISVESRLGEGTRFDLSFTLPTAEPDGAKVKKEAARRTADFGGMTVLAVEDNAMNREIMKKILSSVHCTVVEAVNGQEAVDRFRESEPYAIQAILMDIHMPVMDGYTATAEIRALARADAMSVPIIALTADAFSEDVEKSLRLGMNKHLSKPINIALLIETLSEIKK